MSGDLGERIAAAVREAAAAGTGAAVASAIHAVRPDELAAVQTTITGQHAVGLATTSGLAARLLVNAERGFDVDYLDRYPDLVRALTVADVNDAVARHLDPEGLHVAVAGTLPGEA